MENSPRRAILAYLILVVGTTAFGQEELRLSVARLWGPEVSLRDSYLLDSLPLAVYRELETAPPDIATESLRRAVAADRADTHLAALASNRREEADRSARTGLGVPPRGNLRAAPQAPDLSVPEVLRFALGGDSQTPLVTLAVDPAEPGPREIRTLLAALQTDLLIAGELSPLDDYFILDLYLLSRPEGSRRLLLSLDARSDELGTVLDSALARVVNALTGIAYGGLNIVGIDPATELLLDGDPAGFGSGPRRYLQPGTVQVSLRYPDLLRSVTRIAIPPGEQRSLEITERPAPDASVLLQSTPPRAQVLINSRPLGETPLQVPPPDSPSVIVLSRDGFYDAWLPRATGQEGSTTVRLRPLSDVVESRQIRARDRFYASFALFSASLVLPIASQAALDQRAALLLGGVGNDEFDARQLLIARSLQASTAVGAGGSLAAGVLMVVRLLDFLRSSEDAFHTR